MVKEEIDRRKPTGRWLALGVAAAAMAVYVATLAPGLAFEHNGIDGGDLIAAAHSLGVPHPSGYPTYTLLAWLATHLPVGTIAYRANLLSALCAGLAAGLTCLTAQIVLHGSRHRLALSAAAGLTLAFSSLLWSQAVIAEVYALLALFAALLLWLALSWRRGGSFAWLWLTSLALGVGLGNHLTLAFVAPALLVLLWPERREWLQPRVLLPAAGLFLAGLSVYAYLPLAAARQPAVNWGDPQSWDRFWWVVSGGPYRPYVLGLDVSEIPGRIAAWARLLGDQFGWWGLFLAAAGAWRLKGSPVSRRRGEQDRSDQALVIAFLAWGLPTGLYALCYATTDSYLYLLPLLGPLALAWSAGADYLLHLAERFGAAWRRTALVAILLLPLGSLALHWQAADLSHDRTAHDYMQQMLDGAAPGALIVAQGDGPTFALWYGLYAERQRPDVAVVSGPLLAYRWYREQVRRMYPELAVPEPGNGSVAADELVRELIASNLSTGGEIYDRRPVYATDPPEAWRAWFEFMGEGHTALYRVRIKG